MLYTLTPHAMRRIEERAISPEDLAAALEAPVFHHHHGTHMHFDKETRLGVIFNPYTKQIVTAYKLKRKQVKKWCSR